VAIQALLIIIQSFKWNNLHRYLWKIKHRTRTRRNIEKRSKHKYPKRLSVAVTDFDIFDTSGLFENQFEDLYQSLKDQIILLRNKWPKKPVATVLTPRARLLCVLNFLREHGKLSTVARTFSVSKMTIFRDVQHMVPKIGLLQHVAWPVRFPTPQFMNA